MDNWKVAVHSKTGMIYLICEEQQCTLNMNTAAATEIANALNKAALLLEEPKSKLVN